MYSNKLLNKYKKFIHIPVICSGGIANDMDSKDCFVNGADAIAIAAAFHFKKTTISAIKASLTNSKLNIRP